MAVILKPPRAVPLRLATDSGGLVWMLISNILRQIRFNVLQVAYGKSPMITWMENSPEEQAVRAEIEDSDSANDTLMHLPSRRTLLFTASLSLAGFIRTQVVFSTAQEDDEAVLQTVSEHVCPPMPSICRGGCPVTRGLTI